MDLFDFVLLDQSIHMTSTSCPDEYISRAFYMYEND